MDNLEEAFLKVIGELFTVNFNKVLQFLFGLIIFVGLIGNALNICVYSKRNMRQSLTFRLLLGLSLTDITILAICALESFIEYKFNFDIRAFSILACKLDTFLAYFLTQARNFLSMGITIERARILSSLQKKPKKSIQLKCSSSETLNTLQSLVYTRKNLSSSNLHSSGIIETSFNNKAQTLAKNILSLPKKSIYKLEKVVYGLLICLFVMNFHFMLFLRVNYSPITNKLKKNASQNNNKNISYEITDDMKNLYEFSECSSEYGSFYETFLDTLWFWLDASLYFLVPFFTMSIAFFFIKFKLKKINRNYNSFIDNYHYNYNKKIFMKKIRKNNKIIYLLFLINMFFFLSIVPFFVFSIYKKISPLADDNVLFKSFVEILFYTNNAFNIFFYGITSKKYRQEFRKFFKRNKARKSFGCEIFKKKD